LGNGSNDVLEMAARAFLAPGAKAVYAQHAFAVYPLATQATGATGVEVPAREYGHDLAAMLRAIDAATRVVFIANPNNPTGTFVAPGEMHAFLRQVPARVLVVLDEAYQEYLPGELQADSVSWLSEFPNLVITRTFSKIYGLAGLRLGYALAHESVADLMNRVRQPFNVNSVALAAAGTGIGRCGVHSPQSRGELRGHGATNRGLQTTRARVHSFAGQLRFSAGWRRCRSVSPPVAPGVIVRPIAGYGMPQHLRVTIGSEPENVRFLQALEESLHE